MNIRKKRLAVIPMHPLGGILVCAAIIVAFTLPATAHGTLGFLVNSTAVFTPSQVNSINISIDIYPNRTPNRVYLSRNYTIYVAVMGSNTFDVATLNSTTVKFGRTGTEASPVRAPIIRDLNGDGYLDAMYGFRTFDCGFALGPILGLLKAKLNDGTPVEGSDSVLVSPGAQATNADPTSTYPPNGGFETGDLTGWLTLSTVQVVNWEYSRDFLGLSQAPASGSWGPKEGNYFATLWSTNSFGTDISMLDQTFTTPVWTGSNPVVQFDYFYDFGDITPFREDPATIYVIDSLGNLVFEMIITDRVCTWPSESADYTCFGSLGDDQNIDWTTGRVFLPSAGTYTIVFDIEDSIGVFESILGVDNVRVLWNEQPVADAGPDQTVSVTDTVTLDGSGSTSPDGDPLIFEWFFSSKPPDSTATLSNPTAVKPTFVVDKPGTYRIDLIVWEVDDAFQRGYLDWDWVTIETLNSAPIANAGVDQTVHIGDPVTLDGSGSSDIDGDPLTYRWYLEGEIIATGVNPTIELPIGEHVIELIVNDGTQDSEPDEVIVEVFGLVNINIDIYPNRTPNWVFLSRNYTLYVAIQGNADFDVTNMDSSSVLFGQTGTEASPVRAPIIRDLNGDGFLDAMYGFGTFDCGFQLGDTEGWLTGFTVDGIPVEGSDSVVVSP